MDTTAIAAAATALSQAETATAVQLAVLKKAMSLQAEGAAQLVAAAVQPLQTNNPPHLGNGVDTFA